VKLAERNMADTQEMMVNARIDDEIYAIIIV
jgi:hypothetical protein